VTLIEFIDSVERADVWMMLVGLLGKLQNDHLEERVNSLRPLRSIGEASGGVLAR